jgi:hypothetical protein
MTQVHAVEVADCQGTGLCQRSSLHTGQAAQQLQGVG